jgi:penicillin-binding protein 1A
MARFSLSPVQTASAPRVEPRARRRRWLWPLLRFAIILAIWGILAGTLALLWLARDIPRPETALDTARRPGLTLLDRGGRSFATFGDVVGEPLRLSEMPKALPAAAVAVEDRRFWTHHGIDVVGIARALVVNMRAGHLVQGGSTITQQVAKNLFLTNARTMRRKVQELILTLWLEHTFSKAEILEIWLNRVYLGSGTWGVDAAAHMYFGIPARRLNLWQSAVLAGLPRAPSRFNPRTDPAAAVARGREVLAAMADTGAITKAEADAAAAQISFPPRPATAGWFADWVADASPAIVPQGADAVLRTTLDPYLQSVAETRLDALLAGPGEKAGVGQGAIIILDAGTGSVRAMVGGRDYRSSPYNRAVAARRQPGSSFKPVIWLAALERGLHPDDTVLDAPIHIGTWNPQNFDLAYRGEVTLTEALAQSLNTASIRLAQQAGGPQAVIAVARRLGIASPLPNDLSIALGTGEVGMLELAAAYATIFNGGRLVTPTGIDAVDVDHHAVPVTRPPMDRVIDSDRANEMTQMLAAVVAHGSGHAAAIPGRFVAGKTGTTQDSRDAWFVGEVGTTVIAIWLGNDDGHPTKGVTGGGLPAKLFHDVAAEVR